MGVIVTLGSYVLVGLSATAVVVATAVVAITYTAVVCIAALGAIAMGMVAALIEFSVAAFTLNISGIVTSITNLAGIIGTNLTFICTQLATTYTELKVLFTMYLQIIHYKALINIHSILLIVSSDYQEVVMNFWNDMRDVSRYYKLADETFPLVLRNSQQIHCFLGSLSGQSFHVSHLQWMKRLSDWNGWVWMERDLLKIDNLGQLFGLIDFGWPALGRVTKEGKSFEEYAPLAIDSLSFDALTAHSRLITEALSKSIELGDALSGAVLKLQTKLDDLTKNMPSQWQKEIKDHLGDITKPLTSFISDNYQPFRAKVETVIPYLEKLSGEHGQDISDIKARLIKPMDYLSEINNLPEIQRIEQEGKLHAIYNRATSQQISGIYKKYTEGAVELDAIKEALAAQVKPPEFEIPEKREIIKPQENKPKDRDSWFVGDF